MQKWETLGTIKAGAQKLAAGELKLSNGKNNVSADLQKAIEKDDDRITQLSLECVYAARCSLFHGDEKPVLHVPNSILSTSADYLDSYLKQMIPFFVTHCKQYSQPLSDIE